MNMIFKPLNGAATTARLARHRPRVVELSVDEANEARACLQEQDDIAQVEAHANRIASAMPPPRSDKDERRAYFVAEIRDWIANRRQRQADYMSPKEIGAAKDRAYLLQRAVLDGVASCYRESIGADHLDTHGKIDRRGAHLVVGVFVLHTIFSDNDKGRSTVTAPRIAKLLGCSEKSVLRAQELLVENRVLCREKQPGLEDRYWPVINRALAGEGTSTTWWLDATSEANRRGRPAGKPRTAMVQSFSELQTNMAQPLLGSENPGPQRSDLYSPPAGRKTPDPKAENPGPQRSDDFTKDFTNKNPIGGAPAAAPQGGPSFLDRIIWQEGLAWLKSTYDGSTPEKDIRSRLGKLRKEYGSGKLVYALMKAQKAAPIEPLDYVTAILRGAKPKTFKPSRW
jgi:hypothetical protein